MTNDIIESDEPVIERIETYAVAVPLPRPPADSHAFLTHWTIPVVEIHTSDGLVGTGCSGVHTGADLLCTTIDRYYSQELLGESPVEIRRLWHRLYHSPLQWIGRAGISHMALSMVDVALWDLAAQRKNVPLWRLLGGHHPEVRAYNTDGGWLNRSIEELAADLSELVADGWDAVKMKVGKPDWREDVERVQAAREAIGPDVQLACDANKVWDLHTAMRILPYLEAVDMAWIEEPMHPDDVAGHAALQSATRVPVAVGESLYSRFAFRDFVNADAARLFQIDVTRVGGVSEYLEIASCVQQAGLPVIPHAGDMMQVHQHLVAASFATKPATIEYIPWTLDAYEHPCVVKSGQVQLPTAPGASTRIKPEARKEWGIPDIGMVTTK